MRTQTLGTSDLQVSQIGYGAMSIGGSWDDTPPLPGQFASQLCKSCTLHFMLALTFSITLIFIAPANLKKSLRNCGKALSTCASRFFCKPNRDSFWSAASL